MPRAGCFLFTSAVIVLGTASFGSGLAAATQKKAAPGDTPPILVSKDANAPKWKSLEQLKQFAAKGDPAACFELADRCLEGDGVPKDPKRAAELFEQAGKGGVANAWFRLGKISHDGLNGPPDYGRALDCFSLAARAGVAEAQHNIGAMLVSARGVKRDYVEGLAWLIVAARPGIDQRDEAQVRTRLARRPADIKAAEARAVELAGNLAGASVHAIRTATSAKLPAEPGEKPVAPATAAAPAPKPVIAAPSIDKPAPVKISLPAPANARATPAPPEKR